MKLYSLYLLISTLIFFIDAKDDNSRNLRAKRLKRLRKEKKRTELNHIKTTAFVPNTAFNLAGGGMKEGVRCATHSTEGPSDDEIGSFMGIWSEANNGR
eukprot:3247169-Ditylum_brightwellii.AAC.1